MIKYVVTAIPGLSRCKNTFSFTYLLDYVCKQSCYLWNTLVRRISRAF